MASRVLMVHFTPPGVIGGVEHIMHQHIDLLRARGFEIDMVAGRPGTSDVPVCVIPEIDAASGVGQEVEVELARGIVGDRFYAARRSIETALRPLVAEAGSVIVHNAYTLHFSLPLTSVLWELGASQPPGKMIAWCHDLSWTNPLYIPLMHEGLPWSLLREPAPNTAYVTVSRERRNQLLDLWGDRGGRVAVIPNGIDAQAFWRLSPAISAVVAELRLLERDIVLLLPVRITRRKNIEAAIRTVRSLKDRGLDVCFLVSGPQAPHHPGLSDRYLASLKALRAELGVENEVIFLAERLGRNLDTDMVAELYSVADVLLFPSAQEGFGLPILEAGLARAPIVLSDIPIFHEIGGDDVSVFGLEDPAESIAERILTALDNPSSRLYRRVLRDFRWDAIADRQIVPLVRREPIAGGAEEGPAEAAVDEGATR